MADVEAIVDKVFTDDAVFMHAFIIAKGKKSITRTYQFWKSVNSKVTHDIEKAGAFHLGSPNYISVILIKVVTCVEAICDVVLCNAHA